jgi:hypothetical protein
MRKKVLPEENSPAEEFASLENSPQQEALAAESEPRETEFVPADEPFSECGEDDQNDLNDSVMSGVNILVSPVKVRSPKRHHSATETTITESPPVKLIRKSFVRTYSTLEPIQIEKEVRLIHYYFFQLF